MASTEVPIPFSEPPWILGLPSPYYNESHRQWQKNCRAFLKDNLTDHAMEWEEAGDWFLERFGDIVTKIKDARKERRKLATTFDDEIRDRHESVQGKKRSIEEALAEMGKNGKSFLQAGTPKRARRWSSLR